MAAPLSPISVHLCLLNPATLKTLPLNLIYLFTIFYLLKHFILGCLTVYCNLNINFALTLSVLAVFYRADCCFNALPFDTLNYILEANFRARTLTLINCLLLRALYPSVASASLLILFKSLSPMYQVLHLFFTCFCFTFSFALFFLRPFL